MNALLPCYPEVSKRFAQYKREGHSFDTLELFVRHFLREGSVFAIFGFEHLHENGILTELHFHDIQSQFRSISEDFDLLDEAFEKFEAEDIEGPSPNLMKESPQSQLYLSITLRDPIAVGKVLATYPGVVDAKNLCLAISFYERTVFQLLVEHGADVNGAKLYEPLYCAAKAGHMDAVRLLLSRGANKEGNCLWAHPTPLTGAASAGHLDIVKYLVEQRGAKIDGNSYMSSMSGALKNHHKHVVDYLLGVGRRLHPNLDSILPYRSLRFAASVGDVDAVKCLINAGVDVDLALDKPPLVIAASYGHLEVVRLLVRAGANVNPQWHSLIRVGANINPQKRRDQDDRSPLAEAALGQHAEVAHFLSSTGATLLQGEYQLRLNFERKNQRQVNGTCNQYPKQIECGPQSGTFATVGQFLKHVKGRRFEEDCPAIAAVRAQERRTTERRLFAHVASSREGLLDAGASPDASASLREFVAQVGTSSFVFKCGTRAIRDISEGYKPSGLRAIVSALQDADAMRSVVPASKLVYSKEECVSQVSSC